MGFNRAIFREYDIRGLVERDLTGDVPFLIGRAFGTVVRRAGKRSVGVGGDNRPSTPAMREQVIAGLLSAGCDVTDVGEVPSPVVYFTVHERDLDGGLMVTASHNPREFNGFKMVLGGLSLCGADILRMADIIEAGDFEAGAGTRTAADGVGPYLAYMRERFRFSRKIRVGIDTGNGAAGPVVVPLLEALGLDVRPLFAESDGRFPNHLPDPLVAANLKDLIALVRTENLEAGLGIDGDGDRLGVVAETGEILWGDTLLIIYGRDILKRRPGGAVVFDVKCTTALSEEIAKAGGRPIMWKTGHSLIERRLHEEGGVLAGELSGHLYFADEYFGYDDAIYASLRLLRIIDGSPVPVSRMLDGVKRYASTPEIRINVSDERKFDAVRRLQDRFRGKLPTSEIDGVKVLFPDGWALVRASNTQPALVMRVEAENPAALERIKEEFTAAVNETVGE